MSNSRFERFLLRVLNPKVGIPVFVVLVLLASPFIYRSSQLAGLPDIGDPFDVEAFGTVEITDEENAFIEYRDAAALLTEMTDAVTESYTRVGEEGWSAANDELRQWLRDNRAALEIWRKGTQKPRALCHQPRLIRIDTFLLVASNLRDLGRLAQMEGSKLEAEGNFQAAWEWYRAIFCFSRHLGQHGMLLERMIGMALHAITAGVMEQRSRNSSVNADELRKALEAIRVAFQMTPPASTSYKVAYLSLRNSLAEPNLTVVEQFGLAPAGFEGRLATTWFFLTNEPEVTRRLSQHCYGNWLEQIDKPRHARPAQSAIAGLFQTATPASPGRLELSASEIENYLRSSQIAAYVLGVMSTFDESIGREQARQGALEVVLAAQIYRREQGKFPEKAEDLLDGILDDLPADPFAKAGETIHYRRLPEGFAVWSIGPNRRDDGGDFSFADSEDGDVGYEVTEAESPTK
jgi:hypothetical protein